MTVNSPNRIRRGLLAWFGAIAARILLQFVTLPILFAFWHAERVGTWLAIFAVPAYIALVGTGFSAAGGSAALAAAQDGRMAEARADFRASWIISAVSTGLLALLFCAASSVFVPWLAGSGGSVDHSEIGRALAWLAIYIFASSQVSALEIPFRIVGRYPEHMQLVNLASVAEVGVIALCVTRSDNLAMLAMALAATRSTAAIAIFIIARRVAPQAFSDHNGAVKASLRKIWKPSLALMLMPLVYGLNLQGYLLMAGAAYGTIALASFAATRVLTRLLDLLTNLNYAMQFYESGYLTEGKIAVQQRMLATMSLVSLLVSALFAIALLVAGSWAQEWYTLGQTQFDVAVAAVLLAAASVRALAAAPTSMLTADNQHAGIVVRYLCGSALGLVLACLMAFAGLPLAVSLLPLLLAEASQTVPAFALVLRRLDMSFAAFGQSLLSRDRVADIGGFIKTIAKPR